MPLFMLVSGYLFYFTLNKRNFAELISNRMNVLVRPIVAGTILTYYYYQFTEAILHKSLAYIFTSNWINCMGELWFLWSILAASLIIGLIYALIQHEWIRIILLLVCLPLVFLFPDGSENAFMYPYFVIGFLFCQYKDRMAQYLINLKYLSLILFPVMLNFYTKKDYIYTSGIIPFGSPYGFWGQVKIDLFRYAIGFCGSIFVMCLLELLVKVSRIKTLHTVFAVLGKYSLQIYILEGIFLADGFTRVYRKAVGLLGYNILTRNITLFEFVLSPIIASLFAAGIWAVTKLFERLKISNLIFGR